MSEELAHGDVSFAVLRELGPVARHRGIVVEPSTRGRDGQCHGCDALGDRHHHDHGVLGPWLVAAGRTASTPQIDDLVAMPKCGDGSADLTPFDEVALELAADFLETGSDLPLNGGHVGELSPSQQAP